MNDEFLIAYSQKEPSKITTKLIECRQNGTKNEQGENGIYAVTNKTCSCKLELKTGSSRKII